jgi:lipopolysaccharide transport system permease protein
MQRFLTLLQAIIYRELAARYRRSLLGPLWAILHPLILMVVFTFFRGIVGISSEGVPYVIFSYAALVPWTFFTNAVSRCAPSLLSNGMLIKKIRMPLELFPLSAVCTSFFDMCMAGIVLVSMMLYFKISFSFALLWLPVLVCMTALLACATGMLLASLGCFRRDFIIATPFLLQIWLFATPVIYPASSVPERWLWIYRWNPMVGIIEGFRNVLIKGQAPNPDTLLYAIAATALVLLVAWPVFKWLSRYFADVL